MQIQRIGQCQKLQNFISLGNEETNSGGVEVCNHLIAMQTSLDTSNASEGKLLFVKYQKRQ